MHDPILVVICPDHHALVIHPIRISCHSRHQVDEEGLYFNGVIWAFIKLDVLGEKAIPVRLSRLLKPSKRSNSRLPNVGLRH